jgi:phosphatidylethanolamine/phosphatidyl-N-methylethanolamine N-methyltransferase
MLKPAMGPPEGRPTPMCRRDRPPRPPSPEALSSNETIGFFRAWLRDPLRVAAVAPSSRALARLITAEISGRTGPVIELGPGTGAFTRALLARGVGAEDLVLVEAGADFAEALRLRFPAVRTLCMDAARLRTVAPFGERPVGAVVSGLPLLSMAPRQVFAILKGSFRRMAPEGAFYQFTYGPRCPVPPDVLHRLGLEAHRVGRTLANLPPAAVYRIRRTDAHETRDGGDAIPSLMGRDDPRLPLHSSDGAQ